MSMSSRQHKRDADPDCEVCDGEGEYEVVHPGGDGEPVYYMQACECTLDEGVDKGHKSPRDVIA